MKVRIQHSKHLSSIFHHFGMLLESLGGDPGVVAAVRTSLRKSHEVGDLAGCDLLGLSDQLPIHSHLDYL